MLSTKTVVEKTSKLSLFSFLYFKKMEIDRSLYGPYNEYNPKKKLESSRFVREQYEKRGSIDSAVIITVPHSAGCKSYNPNEYPQSCDFFASVMADQLKLDLSSNQIYVFGIYDTSVPRIKLDLNRITARGSDYRRSIIESIKLLQNLPRKKDVWVIDIHSISQENVPKLETTGMTTHKFFVVDTLTDGKKTDYVLRLCDFVNRGSSESEKIHYLRGLDEEDPNTNDIMNTSRSAGAKSFMIIGVEGLTPEEYQSFFNEVADFIRSDS